MLVGSLSIRWILGMNPVADAIVNPLETQFSALDVLALQEANIDARPLWKPMHMQPLFHSRELYGGQVGEALFRDGLCLPSGSGLAREDQDRVIDVIREAARG